MSDISPLEKEELYSELDENSSLSERYFGFSTLKFISLLILVSSAGIYISILLFGDNSLNVLFDLEEYESYLSNEVIRLKTENATLQKEYFELLELDSQ